jgi:demethylmenaquinone methyltransferase/2-methoxy-6-polyprenyl-1,4-benzoquinol methylase
MSENPESAWFGYVPVAPEEKTQRVGEVFSSVADKYDLMNDLMSGGLHRLWKDHFVSQMRPRKGEQILDVAGGTGDITLRCAKATRGEAHITTLDINEDMLRVGREKAIDQGWLTGINWVTGNAEELPFPDHSSDLACISFGLRNITRIDTALTAFARVLRPGGRFFCMEFTPEISAPLRPLYDLYSFTVLPWLGEKVANDRASYQYLAESIRQFPAPNDLVARMENAGFENIHVEKLLGGIVAIHSGRVL